MDFFVWVHNSPDIRIRCDREWSGAVLGEKKFRYTIIAAIAAIVLIGCISRFFLNRSVPEHEPGSDTGIQEHAQEQTDTTTDDTVSTDTAEVKEITVGEETFLAVVQETLNGQIEVSDLSAQIGDNCDVTWKGSVSKAAVTELLKTQTDSISSAYEAVLQMLPDSLPLTLDVQIQADNGAAVIVPKGLVISSMEIPDSMIGEELFAAMQQTLNRELSKQIGQIQSVSSKNGEMLLRGT